MNAFFVSFRFRLGYKQTASSNASCSGNSAQYVRYATSIGIYFQLVANRTDGTIYPPVVVVQYAYASTSDLSARVPITFTIQYSNNMDAQNTYIWIAVGVLAAVVLVRAFFRTWIWNRRAGKIAPDFVSLFKFFMYLCDGVGNVFFVVLLGVAIYWLAFFKAESVAYVVLPLPYQEQTFQLLLIVAFVAKALDILHTIFTQTSYDIFLVDWERPKLSAAGNASNLILPPIKKTGGDASKASDELGTGAGKKDGKQPLISGGGGDEANESNQVSCWRTLFVANEWNELQTFRKVNTTVQIVLVLFFLKVVNLEALTTSDCNTSIAPSINQYQGPYSFILRVAMAASIYVGVGESKQC